MKRSGKYERLEEGESLCIYFAVECTPKSWEICGCTGTFLEF